MNMTLSGGAKCRSTNPGTRGSSPLNFDFIAFQIFAHSLQSGWRAGSSSSMSAKRETGSTK